MSWQTYAGAKFLVLCLSFHTESNTQLLDKKASRHPANIYIITTETDVEAPDIDGSEEIRKTKWQSFKIT